jgi:flavin reductase (DIM6/NTAB) family NADH-FMN oxidoreductase RutF
LTDERKALGAALARIPSGIFILTVRHGERETGMLASWVQQCSFDPPLVSLVVRRGRFVAEWLGAGAAFTLNVLREDQGHLLRHFARGFDADQPAFDGLEVERRLGEAPLLVGVLAHLDGKVRHRVSTGDHELFVGEIASGRMLQEGKPMVHVRKNGFNY